MSTMERVTLVSLLGEFVKNVAASPEPMAIGARVESINAALKCAIYHIKVIEAA